MLKGFLIIFGCYVLGDAIRWLLHLPVPGNVIGMALLTLGLRVRVLPLADVQPVADALLHHLAFLFVPAGVGVMLYFDLLQQELIPILLAFGVSSVIVLLVVGYVQQRFERPHE